MIPTVTLNNGVGLPAIGFGVFQTAPDETADAVEITLRVGYRHIETKVWISDHGYDETLHASDKSATKLGVDQIDLLILHQALPGDFDRTLAAYRALQTLLADGKVRAIGVSNFMADHLDRLLAETSVVPAVNQIEVHPYFQQPLSISPEHDTTKCCWWARETSTAARTLAERGCPWSGREVTLAAVSH